MKMKIALLWIAAVMAIAVISSCGGGKGGGNGDGGGGGGSDGSEQVSAVCGDGIVQAGEQCDDGNGIQTDGCTSMCLLANVCDANIHPMGDRFAVGITSGNCYVSFDDEQTTFSAASSACGASGGHLVTITSAAEDTVVRSVLGPAQSPWIGAMDDGNDTDAVFNWVTPEGWSYAHFAPGQPDDDASLGGNGECLHIANPAGEWNDTNCNVSGFVVGRICEFDF